MPVVAANFLLPASVVLYTFVGGIKATFLTDYIHTFIITIIICYFTIKTYSTPEIPSIGEMYNLVVAAGQQHPVSGNHNGSYLTMTSKNASSSSPSAHRVGSQADTCDQAMLFSIIHLLGNFGLVIMDTGFFTKAFAAAPSAVVPGYIIGGISYFAIPWCLGTIMSLTALSLETTSPSFPTYPNRLVCLNFGSILLCNRRSVFSCLRHAQLDHSLGHLACIRTD